MQYMSRVYIDTANQKECNSEVTIQSCKEEEAKGNIPVVVIQGRTTLKFYVSRDVSVNHILNSFHHEKIKNSKDIKNVVYLTYNSEKEVFENGRKILNYSSPLESIIQEKDFELLLLMS